MRQEAHAIYWKLHTSYLKNNRKDVEKYTGMLSEYPDEQIRKEITEVHFDRLIKIRDNITRGIYGRLHGDSFTTPITTTIVNKERSGLEKEFCNQLVTSLAQRKLAELMHIQGKFGVCREYDLSPYGRLDFLFREGRRLCALEVKMGKAPNSLVSQIDRYKIALELEMCKGLVDRVDAYVLAESYTQYEMSELSRMGIRMMEHRGTVESLRII